MTLSYKFDPEKMVYSATYSTGFRPGGITGVYDADIKAIFRQYDTDYLDNYELGWKTQWDERRVRWNGALLLRQ